MFTDCDCSHQYSTCTELRNMIRMHLVNYIQEDVGNFLVSHVSYLENGKMKIMTF